MSSPDDPVLDAALAEFADHLVPEAFELPTRAHRVSLEPFDLRALAVDPDADGWFAWWVEERIHDALDASWPHDRPLAVAFTSDGYLLRRYDECGCGYRDCATGAASAEVGWTETPWVFVADLPRPRPTWQVVTDEDGDEVDEVLVDPVSRRWGLTWFAEARGRGVARTRAGVVTLLGEQVESVRPLAVRGSPITREFHRLLFRHPARKRYPLGRGR